MSSGHVIALRQLIAAPVCSRREQGGHQFVAGENKVGTNVSRKLWCDGYVIPQP